MKMTTCPASLPAVTRLAVYRRPRMLALEEQNALGLPLAPVWLVEQELHRSVLALEEQNAPGLPLAPVCVPTYLGPEDFQNDSQGRWEGLS